jgi:hypothetical protein
MNVHTRIQWVCPGRVENMKLGRQGISRNASMFVFGFLLVSSGSAYAASSEAYYFFVFSNPVAGHEDEYNKWYNEQHAPDVVAVPGFVTAQRYVKNELPLYRMVDLQVPKYLIIYKIVTDDIEAVFREVNRRLQTGETVISPTFDRATSVSYVYRPFRAEIKGVGGEPEGAKAGPKQHYLQVVFTAMVTGMEREFNIFYDEHHAPELAAIPGFVGAQRMILARPSNSSIPATKYLALLNRSRHDPVLHQARPSIPRPREAIPFVPLDR